LHICAKVLIDIQDKQLMATIMEDLVLPDAATNLQDINPFLDTVETFDWVDARPDSIEQPGNTQNAWSEMPPSCEPAFGDVSLSSPSSMSAVTVSDLATNPSPDLAGSPMSLEPPQQTQPESRGTLRALRVRPPPSANTDAHVHNDESSTIEGQPLRSRRSLSSRKRTSKRLAAEGSPAVSGKAVDHRVVERRYRDRINVQFERLLRALPSSSLRTDDGSSLSKPAILELALCKLEELREQLRMQERERDQLYSTIQLLRGAKCGACSTTTSVESF
jgi:hypothetical protein